VDTQDPTNGNGHSKKTQSRRSQPGDELQTLLEALRAMERGEFAVRLSVKKGNGVLNDIARAFNGVAKKSEHVTAEVVRLEQVVGREGRMHERAQIADLQGAWALKLEKVNQLVADLVQPTTEIARVLTSVAQGDLSQKMALEFEAQPVRGEFLRIGTTVNTMVDQLRSFAGEVTRVAKEVGTEGNLGGQADVKGVSGVWKDLTDNVNFMARNLTDQVRNIADVSTAVAKGDLSKKITVEAKGEIFRLKETVNTMVDQLRSFAGEVTRVAKEVGTEGKLGGQADVKGVSGVWKDLTDNVNFMARNLTDQVRNIAKVSIAIADGDLSQKIAVEAQGEILALKNTINIMVDQLRSFAAEVTRVAKEVGTEGKLGGQADVKGVSGVWKDLTDNVNFMARNLTDQVRNIALVTTAVARGDLSKKITIDVKGELLELKGTINTMVDQLNSFASEVTRVAKEVGSEGRLGGQAEVQGVSGVWKDLTDNVNHMARNLTTQVRGIVKVVTAVATGDLKQKLTVEAKGEIAALAETINNMTDTLGTFADQVSTVAREVGVEGKLGGQARVPGVAGTWKELTDNVNQLAASLTTQIRAIAEVATAVTKGDLTRSISVEAAGEVAALKDNINQMIVNLRETTQKNMEQDWLKTNLARFSGMMQGQKNLDAVARLIMSELTPLVGAHHGAFFMMDLDANAPTLKLTSSYAYRERKSVSNRFLLGEGLVGQCALEKKPILLTKVPADYIAISSGLGEAPPLNIIVLPVLFEGEVKAVIELASFHPFSVIHQIFLDQLMESIGVVLNMISANMRTEELLLQSQSLTQELQSQSRELQIQQEELKRTNVHLEAQAQELEDKARLLEEQKTKVEEKNREVELARASLEEKAEQLALISKYKSEFLANMSHELRTPLNSLLILAKLLTDNKDGNLTPKQVEYAQTIYASGGDLLTLINEILDLSKVEAGKMQVEPRELVLEQIKESCERQFGAVATQKGLEFQTAVGRGAPLTLRTDPQRLYQILKNLLANAFKFTDRGYVRLSIRAVERRPRFDSEGLRAAKTIIAFEVKDTGIGIPREKRKLIFEAFQQADGSTARKYGGTGLGLSISREIARLLGGEIQLESEPGKGSTFTLFLPNAYRAPDAEETAYDEDDRLTPEPPLFEEAIPPETDAVRAQRVPLRDDRDHIRAGDRVLLIIEDDDTFAGLLLDLARQRGFKGLVATRGDTGLALANEYLPDAITLDIRLPILDGWELIQRLKKNPRTRHIPVHVITVTDQRERGPGMHAFAYLEKPVSKESLEAAFHDISEFLDRKVRRLLLVEDDAIQRRAVTELIGDGDDVDVVAVSTAKEAVALLERESFDCMVVDLGLPDTDGYELIENIKLRPEFSELPVVVYTGSELGKREHARLEKYVQAIIPKGGAKAPEKLLDETALFLHRAEANIPESRRRALGDVRADVDLDGRKVLVVDDDVRNIFALTSVLENARIQVLYAENGKAGIEALGQNPDVDLVLMDVMMPEMDGYETMRAVRQNPRFRNLPIIAITAKALKDDREKCIEAGASDYLPKPVDTEKLVELIKLWLRK